MTKRVLIDTDILIDVARSVETAIERLAFEAQAATLTVSVVTQMELVVGCRNKAELRSLRLFLKSYDRINITETIGDRTVGLLENYSLSHGLLIPDALIAASALTCGIPLLSKNQRDYRFVAGLILLPYP